MHLPLGFSAAGVACGIKSDPSKLDLALFLSDRPATAAGVFTQNQVVGAPVKVSRSRVPSTTVRGVVLNSGCSNACTGQRGIDDAQWMTAAVAEQVGCQPEDILVCSTGIIGHFLPRQKLAEGIPVVSKSVAAGDDHFLAAARAMMTTDTVPKQAMRKLSLGGKTVTISGACKGAAMIAPNMATMLAVVMTDVRIIPETAQKLLTQAVNTSFNCISVDQHTSTSDTVLFLANGATGITIGDTAMQEFQQALTDVCQELSQKIIRDAEGAEHFVTVDVIGARTSEEAYRMAKSVCDSPLVKTAVAGNDPNWGRIVSAAGYSGVKFFEEECSLAINGIEVYRAGAPTQFDADAVSAAMKTGEVHFVLTFTHGKEQSRCWTCDLTAEYVRLNADYST
ncbi:Arginine biosynthesis bifunctional protein ArgJ [Caulifigura coniformis]|uniref:Arginine biosynthesis bifunctional protein ArgJ n=1 Tax=Caulifigura coniformis TaxID=2527983 RepID=A0A517SKM8_9PLAN|nr:bifunctional glutamate N-acetyltransferase/amino-acid acetyltransferase ArgJ [Caulifigura coniformis]QDT56670.1 Arginine biosynthesis bifunctional protein ArgJ [Caulifigura coniformis]